MKNSNFYLYIIHLSSYFIPISNYKMTSYRGGNLAILRKRDIKIEQMNASKSSSRSLTHTPIVMSVNKVKNQNGNQEYFPKKLDRR